jgi:hypothetical protein
MNHEEILLEQENMTPITWENNYMYVIGLCNINVERIIIDHRIPLSVFYRNNYQELYNFLLEYATFEPNWMQTELLQLQLIPISNRSWFYYNCIIKTYFLRLLQKKWKSFYYRRKKCIENSAIMSKFIYERQIGKRVRLIF